MAQTARRLTDAVDGSWWATAFSSAIATARGPTTSAASSKAPRTNRDDSDPGAECHAYAARFVRSLRGEWLDRLIPFGERRLIRALDEFVAHYHGERNHQGLGNDLIDPAAAAAVAGAARVRCRDLLGGLRYHHRAA